MPTEALIAQGGLGIVVVVLIGLLVWIFRESRDERRSYREQQEKSHGALLGVVTQNTQALAENAAATREHGEVLRELRASLNQGPRRRVS